MARFYLDEDIGSDLAFFLRNAGHDVVTTDEAGLRSSPDSDQLIRAWAEQRILVTHNSDDFFMLHLAWTSWPYAWASSEIPQHAGIAVIPQPPRFTHAAASAALNALVVSNTELENAIVRLRASDGWTRLHWRASR